ncbi:MAG: hypothetical protein WC261_10335 [Synergistaceae bacterium]|jgi:hypothetical protein
MNRPQTKNRTDQLIQELREEILHLRWDNLQMRLEIEIMTERPQGLAAKKIRRKYQSRRDRFLTIKN